MFSGPNNLSYYSQRNFFIWMTLAFQAGCINVGGFLACKRFVSHTTGFATLFGAELAQGHTVGSIGMLTVPLFFLAGTMISAYFVDHRAVRGLKPRYDLLFLLITAAMILSSLLGASGAFGTFGDAYSAGDYALLAMLCLASGIQNASVTSASGSVVRTTHLTGITTDLGIGLVRVFSMGFSENVRSREFMANIMRAGIILSFVAGSTVSAFVFLKTSYWGFLVPALTSMGIYLFSYFTRKKES